MRIIVESKAKRAYNIVMAGKSFDKLTESHYSAVTGYAAKQHVTSTAQKAEIEHNKPKLIGEVGGSDGRKIQLLSFSNEENIGPFLHARHKRQQIAASRENKRQKQLRARAGTTSHEQTAVKTPDLSFDPLPVPSFGEFVTDQRMGITANRMPLKPMLFLLGALTTAGAVASIIAKPESTNIGNLLGADYTAPPKGVTLPPNTIDREWVVDKTIFPNTSNEHKALEGITVTRERPVIVLTFPDNSVVPIQLPGMDGEAAKKRVEDIIFYTWQDSWENSRQFAAGTLRLPFAHQAAQLEILDVEKIKRAIIDHPDFEHGRLEVPSTKMPGTFKNVTPEGAVKAVEANLKLAKDVATVLGNNDININGAKFGIFGSVARGEADHSTESDYDVQITVTNYGQFVEVFEALEYLADGGHFQKSLAEAYSKVGIKPQKGLHGHIVLFYVEEATGKVLNTVNELMILR